MTAQNSECRESAGTRFVLGEAQTTGMREHIVESPGLFDALPDAATTDVAATVPAAEIRPERVARDFVRWLFSFGPDFRNSPDMTNLRFWLNRQKLDFRNGEEREIAAEARALFAKKVEQLMRQAESRPPGA
jgi:hypothetical protein